MAYSAVFAHLSIDVDQLMALTPEDRAETVEWWTPIVYNADGNLDEEKVLAELHDFRFMIQEVPKVYSAVTGERCSKPNYYASGVLSAHEDYMAELIEEMRHEAVKDALDMIEAGSTKDEVLKEFPSHDYTR